MSKKKTLEQLQEEHSQMCATASDLGLDVPADLTIDFDSAEVGATVVSNLDAMIRKHRAGLDEQSPSAGVAQDAETEQSEEVETEVASPATETGESKVAKKATAKKASKPKAASPKKGTTAKKAVAAKGKGNGVAKTNGVAKRGFAEEAKINWTAKTNPAREGSGRHERIEAVRKSSGKTVKTYLANKGNPTTLRNCVNAKLCTVA